MGIGSKAGLTPACCLADAAYESDTLRAWLRSRGWQPLSPNTPTRKRQQPFDQTAYRTRHGIERTCCWLKDWRRVATHYDKLAHNSLVTVTLAAIVLYWV